MEGITKGRSPSRKIKARIAVMNCIIRRIKGLSPLMSSIRLTIANNTPLNNAKKRLRSIIPEKNRIDMPVYHVRTIAIPPPFGVGKSCKLLSFGVTVIFFLTAQRIIIFVRINEMIPSEIIIQIKRMNFKLTIILKKLKSQP